MMFFAVALWALYTVLLALVLAWGVRERRLALISFATILFVVSNIRQVIFFLGLNAPHPQHQFNPTEWALLGLANIVLISWVMITMASYAVNGPLSRLIAPIFPAKDPQQTVEGKPRGVLLTVLVPFLVSVGGTAYLVTRFGGLAEFTFAVKVSKDLAGLYIIRSVGVLASMMAFYAVLSSMQHSRKRLSPMTFVYIGMVIATMAATFAWGNRYTLALTFLSYLIAWHLHVRRLNPLFVAALGIGAMVLLQSLKTIRIQLFSEATGQAMFAHSDFWLSTSLSLHFVQIDALMLALRDAGVLFDFRGARDFINGLLSWLPRSVYPAKETFHVGGWFRQVYEPWTVNGWPVTTPGSWYVNFGLWGIPIGAWISGLMMRAFDSAFDRVRESAWHAAIGPMLALFFFDAGLGFGFPQKIFLYIIPLYLAIIWISTLSRRRRRAVVFAPARMRGVLPRGG